MKLFSIFSQAVRRQPVAIIALVLLLFFLAMELSQQVEYAQGFDTYFSKEHKEYKQYKLFTKDFGTSIASAYVFVKGDDVVNYETFEYMLKLGDVLSTIDGVGEIKSPAHSIVNRLGYLPQDEKTLESYAYKLAQFYIPKRSFALMEIEITASQDKYNVIAKEIERKLQLVPKPTGVVVEATGNPLVRYQVNQAISGSMKSMGMAAVLLMVVILGLVFRGVVSQKRFLMLPLVISVFTAVMAYGLMPVLGIPLTEVTNAFFPVLIGLSIEYAAQFQSRFEEEMRKGRSAFDAAEKAIFSVGTALSLAMITTVIGFLSMVFSGVPSLSWFGFLSAIGLIIAYLLSLTFLPAVLVLLSGRVGEVKEKKAKNLETFARGVARRSNLVLILTVVLVTAGFYGYSNVGIQTDFYKYIPQDLPAIRKMNELKSLVGSQDRVILVMETDGVDMDTIEKFDAMCRYVASSEPQVTDYSNIATLLSMYGMPKNDYQLENVLDRLPDVQKKKYVSGGELAAYFTVAPMDWLEFKDLYERVKEEINFYGLGQGYYLTGDVVLKMFVADLIINGQNKMTLASYALVFLLLLFVYRSFSKAVVPLLPITTVIAVVGGVMYLLGINRTLVSASLNSLTIGLGIDFSIHIMERYLEERRMGMSPEDAVAITVSNTGRAIITSGLTMAGGFAAMMVSPFPIMRDFGFVSVISIIFSLIAALTVVPAFLVFIESLRAKRMQQQ
ncbi:efflux RND transporter permease subunit [Archaeoglobus veneficus]|uniref:Efflux transporter, hydrophobe/amphiphile efflux-3 (HAE3) family n=1 Tax=Archaeoglobus veneficus (strain DSM 11195 / SNP6) TaxID=693661 RepID=F2KMQ5_ARCVS|nr:RND family transporter [Archaeoglobus veneficus]AEA46079.1 efflux transporter, hydrophobe/amphiphile efflux-3 (HAE3) family [Archaeoglobus veneficus SNP6]